MSQRLISVIAAPAGHLVRIKQMSPYGEPVAPWSAWTAIIAFGFTEWGETVPITLKGAPRDDNTWQIKSPDGTVV